MRRIVFLVGILFGAAACSDTGFQGTTGSAKNKPQESDGQPGDGKNPGDIDFDDDVDGKDNGPKDPKDGDGFDKVNTDDGNAKTVFEDSDAGVRKEEFGYGGSYSQPKVDYLFIMDNSCSMGQIIAKTAAGFNSLVSGNGDVFPDDSKIAVMNTMPAKENDFSQTFVNSYGGAKFEPGFMALVSEDRIEDYRNAVPGKVNKWKMDGCSEWFDPDEKNGDGDSCLTAHTQQTYHCTGAEAGGTALFQFMAKQGNDSTFRDGAIVNIIFVSDTHDPGNGNATLANIRPTSAELTDAIKENNKVAGVKFHAIAPESKCTGEGMHGLYYYGLVDDTDGVKADPCKNNDYSGPIESIVDSSDEIEDPVFVLSKESKKIVSVYVDGKETEDYKIDDDGQTVIVDGLAEDEKVEITIVYRYK